MAVVDGFLMQIRKKHAQTVSATGVCEKKHPLRKFVAKASFEAWSTASDVVFREESEFKVKNGPKLFKNRDFCKIRKNLKIRNFENFENFLKF